MSQVCLQLDAGRQKLDTECTKIDPDWARSLQLEMNEEATVKTFIMDARHAQHQQRQAKL